MIPFNFDYYKPSTIKEAINLFEKLQSHGKKPIYYAGGTEFISMARMNNRYTEAVIDIKGIPDCSVYQIKNENLIIGSAVTLTDIAERNLFPLLSLTVKRIADHTIQGKITLGGNLAGTIIYKEASLPLLLSNSEVIIYGITGKKKVTLSDIFHQRIKLDDGDLITQIIINKKFLDLPYSHVKRTKNEKIDYPLITVAAIKDTKINIAFSGLCEYPFRSTLIEDILNDNSISFGEKMKAIIENLPDKILDDLGGSSEYRKFILDMIISEILESFEEVS